MWRSKAQNFLRCPDFCFLHLYPLILRWKRRKCNRFCGLSTYFSMYGHSYIWFMLRKLIFSFLLYVEKYKSCWREIGTIWLLQLRAKTFIFGVGGLAVHPTKIPIVLDKMSVFWCHLFLLFIVTTLLISTFCWFCSRFRIALEF